MVKFVKEIPPTNQGPDWADRLAPLMERPGEWAELDERPADSAPSNWPYSTALRIRTVYTLPSGTSAKDWEFKGRTLTSENRLVVYGRYIKGAQ